MEKSNRVILDAKQFDLTIKRLAHQLIENHNNFTDTVILGMQPRGLFLANRIQAELLAINKKYKVQVGSLDTTFYRDDYRRQDNPLIPSKTQVDFIIEDKKVVLIDDVLFTGRSVRAGLDAMLAFGRPSKVELLVLINRRYERDLPIQAKYIGKNVHSVTSERVEVSWVENEGEDKVILYTPAND
ncbi:bifunctional pyr operon transcriptional regulator/uracil phosphoribosyltransferase PyrR [Vicingus serpentipes]|jgi:pyrimidine operon attenuation protein / uracil phosphoribosyltransferase|uniref:Bifunctional pyr operon transcriptional regulator/uracil phosphoribosyltransferase PyrR n=1 Tax=Vicingus serpentipes TaxID=1926625 RepID=A0A5C6RUN9_9FLAO|nr:bifunctional pyr operon transcriptional regulator/uracil phosphoribosyltransferase PyrR [Vicingus serpentipes]TXB65973.1 bifunctional pyr operon transcriptional regulator/uracil phosphoribosyltransferase PyrR [Vicingus serpentipes]